MKIKFILFLFFSLFFFNSILYSDEVEIISDNIKILDNGKIIESIKTNAIIKDKGLYIEGDYSVYNKETEIIKFENFIKSEEQLPEMRTMNNLFKDIDKYVDLNLSNKKYDNCNINISLDLFLECNYF